MQSGVNLVHATFLPGRKPTQRAPGEPAGVVTMAVGVDTPSKAMIFDVLAHEDLFPGQDPALEIYRTVGVVSMKHAGREVDRMDVRESVQRLGKGIAKFRAAETPEYQDVIRHVCSQRGWDANALRGYRCRIDFPIYSSEIVLGFELPEVGGASISPPAAR